MQEKGKNLQSHILKTLADQNQIPNTFQLSKKLGLDHQVVVGAIKSLQMDDYVETVKADYELISFSQEAEDICKNGSPEFRLSQILKVGEKVTKTDLAEKAKMSKGQLNLAISKLIKKQHIKADKQSVQLLKTSQQDPDAELLRKMKQKPNPQEFKKQDIQSMKKRKAIKIEKINYFHVKKGCNFKTQRVKEAAELTKQMLKTQAWKNLSFKSFKLQSLGKISSQSGSLHPLLQMREQFRQILLQMGFEQMPTNRWVENSFWNFDSLFQPQQHPARDMHDTFYLKQPKNCKSLPEDNYVQEVKKTHQRGGAQGSTGYDYKWSEQESRKNILRTHTTAVSSRMLYKLAQDYKESKKFTPKKYFSIDRVFRNETLDKTHLAEFHQVEGLVADQNLGLSHLIGIIQQFFIKFGIKKLKFKPAYNPYTEPSLQIFARHPAFDDWVQIGNSGVFRPEMLRPMGLPQNVNVIAWGLSLERPTMITTGIDNIRLLFGSDLEMLEDVAGKMPILNITD